MMLLGNIKNQMKISDYLTCIERICNNPYKDDEKSKTEIIEKKLHVTSKADSSVMIAASVLKLTAAYIGNTAACSSSPLGAGAGAMEISLIQCGIDDESLHSALECLSEECSSALFSDVTEEIPSQDITMTLNHHHISNGDYLSRILSLNLKGNCLTDLSCEVKYIGRTVCAALINAILTDLFIHFYSDSLSCSLTLSLIHTRTHTPTHKYTRAHIHTRTHTQTLSALVERSAYLRTVDLRDNVISLKGVKSLTTALERNPRYGPFILLTCHIQHYLILSCFDVVLFSIFTLIN